jgi:hypothetical protein
MKTRGPAIEDMVADICGAGLVYQKDRGLLRRPALPSRHRFAALDMAVIPQWPNGARGQEGSLVSDKGCQPTSLACMQACHPLRNHQACTSSNNPQGHADTERVMRTINEECLWLQAWTSPFALIRALEAWIADDKAHDLHSAPGYQSPRPCEHRYHFRLGTPFVAA